jgi:hypothetical protein
MNYTQPTNQPVQPTQQYQPPYTQPTPQQEVPVQGHPAQPAPQLLQVEPNTNSFIADANVQQLIQMVHPELASAMINIAIKKFSESSDFVNYFMKDEYKEYKEKENRELQSGAQEEQPSNAPVSQPASTPAPASIDFAQW